MAKETKKSVKKVVKKKAKSPVFSGSVFVQSSFNNTIISITDDNGNVISWASAGSIGFKALKNQLLTQHNLQQQPQLKKLKEEGLPRCAFT